MTALRLPVGNCYLEQADMAMRCPSLLASCSAWLTSPASRLGTSAP